jgi:hypothetical protein
MAEGESLREICADLKEFGCPTASRFTQRVLDEEDFATRYARARVLQCEAWADRIYSEATTAKIGERTKSDADGKVIEITTGDTVERSRLAVDGMKWLLSKLHPKQYGDKVTAEIGGIGGGAIVYRWASDSESDKK